MAVNKTGNLMKITKVVMAEKQEEKVMDGQAV